MKRRFRFIKFLFRAYRYTKKISSSEQHYKPAYRVANIEKNKHGDYEVLIQFIGKNSLFKLKPEDILADDNLVNQFSPTDIRTLTYLGYLEINSPKYKILAKKLSENNDQMLFAIHKKGEKDYRVITANEISQDKDMIQGLTQEDAHMIGITSASEQTSLEEKQKAELLRQLKASKENKDPN